MSEIKRVRLTDELIERYLTSAKVDKMAPNTKRSKERTLRALAQVIKGKFTCELTADDIDDTLTLLKGGFGSRYKHGKRAFHGRTDASLNVDRSNLRGFVGYLHGRKLLSKDEDPIADVELSGDEEELALDQMILTDDQVRDGFVKAGLIHPRDRALFALGIYLCQRESEILDLRWGHLHLDAERPYTEFRREKQNKFHKLFLPPTLVEELRQWKKWVENHNGQIEDEWYVIPSRPSIGVGTLMHPEYPIDPTARVSQCTRAVKAILAAVGMVDLDRKGVHTLRRTGAVKLYRMTKDLKLVQNWLGHSDIRTTMKYLRYMDAEEQLANAAESYDPYGMAATPVPQEGESSNVVAFRPRKAG